MQRVPIFRISLANATLLTGVYLAVAVVVNLVRRQWTPRWAELLAEHLEDFPARTLKLVGLFDPLRQAYLDGQVSHFAVRCAMGLTVAVVIYATALLVGCLMWAVRAVWLWKQARDGSAD